LQSEISKSDIISFKFLSSGVKIQEVNSIKLLVFCMGVASSTSLKLASPMEAMSITDPIQIISSAYSNGVHWQRAFYV
jgi:hypothetical protein